MDLLFLLDENVPRSAEQPLVDIGARVVLVRDVLGSGAGDEAVLRWAQGSGATLITHDRHFSKPRRKGFVGTTDVCVVLELQEPDVARRLRDFSGLIGREVVESRALRRAPVVIRLLHNQCIVRR